MQNIVGLEGENLGGITRLFFIEQKNLLEQQPTDGLLLEGTITLSPGTEWHFFIPTPYTTSFTEEEERTPHGYLYTQEVKGFRAKDNLQLAKAWLKLRGKKMVLLAIDANNQCRLIGNTEDFLMITRKLDTGSAPSIRNGYNFSFKGTSTEPAKFFVGTFTVSEEGPTPTPGNTGSGGGPVTIKDVNGNTLGIVPAGSTFTLPDIWLTIDDKYLEI
ncbi:hypothetical protein EFA69_16105 [Rufibacter immobilis]|uniref:Uncharacterized protein n=1 Tax=Rufibacter immobilis TaxID=1348778 RepID=A0A3M9MQ54_9BACT|nr:hypothetical protein [Rufibacter immobilis]RNI27640.1 hypothetical protein EFA69_16105 [Rufibacter immobilis]